MRTSTVILGFAALLAVAAENPSKKLDQEEQKQLQGTWRTLDWQGFAKNTPAEELKDLRLTIKGNEITARYGDKMAKATFKLEAAHTPARIDLILTEGPEKLRGKVFKGIYLIEGPVFRIAFTEPGQDRPKDYPTPGQMGVYGVRFRQEKTK